MTLEAGRESVPQPEQWPNVNPNIVISKVIGIFDQVDNEHVGKHKVEDLEIEVTKSNGGNSHVQREGMLAVAKRGGVPVAEVFSVNERPRLGLTGYFRLYGNNNGIETIFEVFEFASGLKTTLFRPAIIDQEPPSRDFIRESVALLLNS